MDIAINGCMSGASTGTRRGATMKSRQTSVIVFLASGVVFSALLISASRADSVTPANYSANAGSCGSGFQATPQSCTFSQMIGTSSLSWAAATVATPGVSAQFSLSTFNGFFPVGGPSATLNYWFDIVGPTGINVPIIVE